MNHYIYKITNNINGKYYIGARSCNCQIKDDLYLGSGKILKQAIKRYGKQNFTKEILAQFNSRQQAFNAQKEIVNQQFIKLQKTYNITIGGNMPPKRYRQTGNNGGSSLKGTICVKDMDGNCFRVPKDDPRWISGELKGVSFGKKRTEQTRKKQSQSLKGMVTVRNENGQLLHISVNDPNYLNGIYKNVQFGRPSPNRGKKLSQNHKIAISAGHNRRKQNGHN